MRARLDVGCLAALVALGILGASCSDADKEFDADEDPGSVRGVIRSGTADYFDEGRSEKVYAIQKKDGSLVRLEGFRGAPGVRPGSEVRIYGPRTADSIRVDIIKILQRDPEGIGEAQQWQRSGANPPALSPPLKNAFVSLTPTYTDAKGKARLTKADFIKPVMEVSSYGRWTTEWEFYGPYTVPNDCGGSFYDNIGKNGTAAMKAAGVDPAQFNQIQFNIGTSIPACSWGGFGWDGHTPIRTDGMRGMYNPWSYVKNDGENVMVQEIGHNWGLAHVHFCTTAGTPSPTCDGFTEYGSPFTPMANGNNVYLNAWERIQMNFFSGCNVLTVGTSGSYDIGPLNSTCEGPQVLRIAADLAGTVQRYWYLEYRQPYGIETANGVLLHYSADIKNGGWSKCDYGGPDCPEDWVVNPTGGKADQALLPAGTMWTTPEGVTVNIASLGTTAKFDLTFPKAGAAPFCDLSMQPWDSKAPTCTAGPGVDGGTIPDSGTGGTGGADAGKDGAAGSAGAGTGGAGGATDAGLDVGSIDATGGKGGTGGMAGASGTGGAAGTTGGKGGAAGVGGTAGIAGAAGTTGGGSGASGSGGASGGQGGSGGTGGTGGSGTTGGDGGTGGTTDDGCGCRVPGRTASSSRAFPLAVMAALGVLARRRRRRPPNC
ncbi:MAG TPA: MYXO-CTERM sorting domain-containing protein [Polyangiaceae bacterium]|nr:MYXO-CTERM sorting domain-containing protein [Polyangiaceae bacterium]